MSLKNLVGIYFFGMNRSLSSKALVDMVVNVVNVANVVNVVNVVNIVIVVVVG